MNNAFFEPLNSLIELVLRLGLRDTVYKGWHIFNITAVLLFLFLNRKHYGMKKWEAITIPAFIYVIGYGIMLLFGWIASGFHSFGANNIVKVFSLAPIGAVICGKVLKKDWKIVMDYTAPMFPLLQCVAHLACNFAGCCHGYPCSFGVWNPVSKSILFPAQLLESFASLLVFLALLFIAKRRKYDGKGLLYPTFLVSFGIARFFMEFTRDNAKLFWGISDLALWAFLMVIVGAAWFLIYRIKQEKATKKLP